MLLPMLFDLLNDKPRGTTIIIVVAPLTSLMQDQVKSCIDHGIKAVAVTRDEESKIHHEAVIEGNFQIVYISLEMLIGTRKWRATLLEGKYQTRLKTVVIDEAHCVKKW